MTKTPRRAIVTGGNGAIGVTRTETAEVPGMSVKVVDTVGAGDSFSGGFLAHWLHAGGTRADLADRDRVVEAARFGIAVAGIVPVSALRGDNVTGPSPETPISGNRPVTRPGGLTATEVADRVAKAILVNQDFICL